MSKPSATTSKSPVAESKLKPMPQKMLDSATNQKEVKAHINPSDLPKVSVITVVYNGSDHIIQTMDSVINQTYPYIEYILIDGASSDNTRSIIESKITHLAPTTKLDTTKKDNPNNTIKSYYLEASYITSHKRIDFKFLSEPDSGIYDAMNKGIDLASGEWCNFMNCGDRFYANDTIYELFMRFLMMQKGGGSYKPEIAVIYGDTQILYDKNHAKILYAAPHHKKNAHKYHHRFIHQSAFIATQTLRYHKYDTHFKIAGDTELFTKLYNQHKPFLHIPVVVAIFKTEGVSAQLSIRMFQEDCKIGFRYNPLFPLFHTLRYIFWVIPRTCVRNLIPKKFRAKARILFGKHHH